MTLDHLTTGTGPGLVLIHGTGSDALANWGPLIDAVRDRFTIVAPNLPGAGQTPVPTAPIDLDALAEQVLATVHAAGLDRFHLVGHSLGAVVATAVAAREPAAVDSLLLHAGWLRSGAREAVLFDFWARLLRTGPEFLARELILTALGAEFVAGHTEEQLAANIAGFASILTERILPQIELDGRIDLSAVAARVSAATLVLASAEDRIVPTYHQRELAAAIAGARYRAVPGGHGLPAEDPERFATLIAEFVDAQQARIALSVQPGQ